MGNPSGNNANGASAVELKQLTTLLLEQANLPGGNQQAADKLYQFFIDLSGLNPKEPQNRASLNLPSGKAIGPTWAAHCIKDALRTKKFLSGIFQAIKHQLEKHPGRRVHVLYAGAGPFAALALPLIPFFKPEEVQFTLLEINPDSVQLLHKVIGTLGFGQYILALEQCDANSYQVPHPPPHIIVVEAMQPGLEQEPQVAITMNLAPQLAKDGVFIPESIQVSAGLLNLKKNTERMLCLDALEGDHYRLLQEVMVLNAQTAVKMAAQQKSPEAGVFPLVRVMLPAQLPPGFQQLCLFTSIGIYGSERLNYWDCHLTHPVEIMALDRAAEPVKSVNFQYVMNEKPGFKWSVSES